jgi:hypothetical protein
VTGRGAGSTPDRDIGAMVEPGGQIEGNSAF